MNTQKNLSSNDLLKLVSEIFNEPRITRKSFDAPNGRLDCAIPNDLIESRPGRQTVCETFIRIQFGAYS